MNGIELISEIRSKWAQMRIILSSGNIDIALEKDYKHLRIDSVLVKPYELDDALFTINQLLNPVTQKIA